MAQMLTGTLPPPPSQVVPPETWQMTTPQGMDEEQPITAKQCAAMIQEALQQRAAPAMGASFGALSGAISYTNNRVEVLEAEVRSLKLRTAWAERDILSSQIEQAKRTIVCRNFPEWLTQGDRELTVTHALTEAGLHIEGGPQLWELTTQRMVGDDGKQLCSLHPRSSQPQLQSESSAGLQSSQALICRNQEEAGAGYSTKAFSSPHRLEDAEPRSHSQKWRQKPFKSAAASSQQLCGSQEIDSQLH